MKTAWIVAVSGIAVLALSLMAMGVARAGDRSDGLIGYWAAEGNADDGSGHGLNGTLASGTYDTGQVGQAFSFDGVSDGVDIADSSEFDITDFTLSAWTKKRRMQGAEGAGSFRNKSLLQSIASGSCRCLTTSLKLVLKLPIMSTTWESNVNRIADKR